MKKIIIILIIGLEVLFGSQHFIFVANIQNEKKEQVIYTQMYNDVVTKVKKTKIDFFSVTANRKVLSISETLSPREKRVSGGAILRDTFKKIKDNRHYTSNIVDMLSIPSKHFLINENTTIVYISDMIHKEENGLNFQDEAPSDYLYKSVDSPFAILEDYYAKLPKTNIMIFTPNSYKYRDQKLKLSGFSYQMMKKFQMGKLVAFENISNLKDFKKYLKSPIDYSNIKVPSSNNLQLFSYDSNSPIIKNVIKIKLTWNTSNDDLDLKVKFKNQSKELNHKNQYIESKNFEAKFSRTNSDGIEILEASDIELDLSSIEYLKVENASRNQQETIKASLFINGGLYKTITFPINGKKVHNINI